MADLNTVTAPLGLRFPDGETTIAAAAFRHPQGVLWFELNWFEGDPDRVIHLIVGALEGDGPWKVGGVVITLLGCHGSDPELAQRHAAWLTTQAGKEPPPRQLLEAIARRKGAISPP